MKKSPLKPLLNIKNRSDIKSFQIIERFEDDHLQCADVKINNIDISFYWYDCLGFLEYWKDSNEAFKDLLDAIQTSYNIDTDR